MSFFQQDQREQALDEEYRPAAVLRILCLHDASSNAMELQESLKDLDEHLWVRHGIELVFVNSPLVVVNDQDDDVKNSKEFQPIRVWWYQNGDSKFLGLDASLLHLQQIYRSTPFIGIIGFGQGATVGSILPPLLQPILEFGIFVDGVSIMEEDEVMMENWPCLHITRDFPLDESTKRLLGQYPGKVYSRSGKEKCLRLHEFNEIGKFIVRQKARMGRSDSTSIVLQMKLHTLEQEVSRLIAEQIAEDPPKSLMAVIQPQSVSGWNRKRREFGAEGGGAPCPSEFLLKRETRTADPNGPSRQHPSSNKAQEENVDTTNVPAAQKNEQELI